MNPTAKVMRDPSNPKRIVLSWEIKDSIEKDSVFPQKLINHLNRASEFEKKFLENAEYIVHKDLKENLKNAPLTIQNYVQLFARILYSDMQHAEKDVLIQILTGNKGTKINTIASWIFLLVGFFTVMWGLAEAYVYLEALWGNYRKLIFFASISIGALVIWFLKEILRKVREELKSR